MKVLFTGCFQQYMKSIQKPWWNVKLQHVWINEMKAGEYNPFHTHASPQTDLGLSSVLMLKRPDTYGKEITNPEDPSNGWLEFSGGDQSPLSISQTRVDAQVGEFYVFPYTLLHTVYPFNSTDEVRRTLSYYDLIKKGKRIMADKLTPEKIEEIAKNFEKIQDGKVPIIKSEKETIKLDYGSLEIKILNQKQKNQLQKKDYYL